MSRAINVSASETDVTAMCRKHNVPISAIEALKSGGTRVVLNNAEDTAVVAKAFRTRVITSTVIRFPFRGRHS